jgi:hypothetical protein
MKFQRELFSFDGTYLTYQGRFVARFKYFRRNMPGFRSFLIKNFEVEEYFGRLSDNPDGDGKEAPLEILKSKGYIHAHIKSMLKKAGYQPNEEGYRLFLEANYKKWQAS